jgi:hypothetical protein
MLNVLNVFLSWDSHNWWYTSYERRRKSIKKMEQNEFKEIQIQLAWKRNSWWSFISYSIDLTDLCLEIHKLPYTFLLSEKRNNSQRLKEQRTKIKRDKKIWKEQWIQDAKGIVFIIFHTSYTDLFQNYALIQESQNYLA